MKIYLSLSLLLIASVLRAAMPIGIPEPPFDWTQATPAEPVDWSSEVAGYYFVDYINGTDSGRTYGRPAAPRKTIPSPITAGSRVQITNSYNSASGGNTVFLAYGSTNSWVAGTTGPVFIVASSGTILTNDSIKIVQGSNAFFDGFIITNRANTTKMLLGSGSSYRPCINVVVRNCELVGDAYTGRTAMAITSYNENYNSNIVVWNNLIHGWGNMETTEDQDAAGIVVENYVHDIWILNNTVSNTSGSGVRLGGAYSYQTNNYRLFVGSNDVSHILQSGLTAKYAQDSVFSENYCHDILTVSWSSAKGLGGQYGLHGLWYLYNKVENCNYGLYIGSTSQDPTYVYAIGNAFYNINTNGYRSADWGGGVAGISVASAPHTYLYNNSIHNSAQGIFINNGTEVYIANNIISTVDSALGFNHIYVNANSTSADVRANDFYQLGGGERLKWNTTVRTLAELQAATGQGQDCITNDPRYFSLSNLTLLASSPALTTGYTPSELVTNVYLTYSNTFGVDIQKDIQGKSRNDATWAMGAYDYRNLYPYNTNFVYPLGVPPITFGLTNSPYEYVGKTYHFSTGDAVYPTDPDGMPYTYWVHVNHAASTDSSNAYGSPAKPRKTWPRNVAPGSVVRVEGGPYSFVNGSAKEWYGGDGTDGTIYFEFKNGYVKNDISLIHGTNIVIDNVVFTNNTGFGMRSYASGYPIINIAIRGGVFKGDGTPASGVGINIGDWTYANWCYRPMSNIFIYSNTISSYGGWDSSDVTEYDNCGITVSGYDCYKVYIISNTVSYSGGDGVRTGGNLRGDSRWAWIAGNTFLYNRENSIDVKLMDDVVYSQNEGYGSFTRGTSAGESIIVHYTPDRVWILGNKLHDSCYGVVNTGCSNLYIIGNEIYNIYKLTNSLDLTNTASKGACIYAYSYYTNWIINNTFYGYDKGISLSSGGTTYSYVINNLFGYRNENVISNGWDILDRSSTNVHVYSNNLYYPTSRFALGSTTEQSLADIKNRGFEQNSLGTDPLIIDGTNDLRITALSPAKDTGATLNAVYDLYYSLYGVAITNDLRGTNRPSFTAWDIGANEVGSTNKIAPTVVITSPTNGFVSTTNVTFTATVSGGTGSTTQMVWRMYKSGSTNLWTNTVSPWTIATNLVIGTWAVYATVLTSDGTNATSVTNTFTVATVPTITLSAPANGLVFTYPTAIAFQATPTAGSAAVTNVSAYLNGSLLGSTTASPWSVTNTPTAGSYSFYATCTDTNGFTVFSGTTNLFSVISSAVQSTNVHWRNRFRRP